MVAVQKQAALLLMLLLAVAEGLDWLNPSQWLEEIGDEKILIQEKLKYPYFYDYRFYDEPYFFEYGYKFDMLNGRYEVYTNGNSEGTNMKINVSAKNDENDRGYSMSFIYNDLSIEYKLDLMPTSRLQFQWHISVKDKTKLIAELNAHYTEARYIMSVWHKDLTFSFSYDTGLQGDAEDTLDTSRVAKPESDQDLTIAVATGRNGIIYDMNYANRRGATFRQSLKTGPDYMFFQSTQPQLDRLSDIIVHCLNETCTSRLEMSGMNYSLSAKMSDIENEDCRGTVLDASFGSPAASPIEGRAEICYTTVEDSIKVSSDLFDDINAKYYKKNHQLRGPPNKDPQPLYEITYPNVSVILSANNNVVGSTTVFGYKIDAVIKGAPYSITVVVSMKNDLLQNMQDIETSIEFSASNDTHQLLHEKVLISSDGYLTRNTEVAKIYKLLEPMYKYIGEKLVQELEKLVDETSVQHFCSAYRLYGAQNFPHFERSFRCPKDDVIASIQRQVSNHNRDREDEDVENARHIPDDSLGGEKQTSSEDFETQLYEHEPHKHILSDL